MDPSFEEAFEDLMDSQVGDHLHESVINGLQKMNHPREAIWQARTLKDNGNVCFKAEEIPMAIEMYERALQFLCGGILICAQDAHLMTELAVTINSNLATRWLRLKEYNRALDNCDLAMGFDACNVKVRCRRALAYLGTNMVEEARRDLEIALKFEPKNKIVSRELEKLEDKYGTKAESSHTQKEQEKGKEVFNPLSTYKTANNKTANIDNSTNSPRDGKREDVTLETFGTMEIEVPKDYTTEQMEEGNTSQGPSEGSRMGYSFHTSGEVDVGSSSPSGMDIDNKSEISSLSEESLGEHPGTVGTSPTEQSCDQVRPKIVSQEKEHMICFSSPRHPNQYLRISRKAYNDLVNGRQLGFVLASKQNCMNVRINARPIKESTPLKMCGVEDVKLSEVDNSSKMGEEESNSASVITTNGEEAEIASMECHPVQTSTRKRNQVIRRSHKEQPYVLSNTKDSWSEKYINPCYQQISIIDS